MSAGRDDSVVRYVRAFVETEKAIRLPDHELLERFVTRHDEDAFAILLRRHGPMVMRVCHRILSNHNDAEDAFQATFLVLCRKASSVRRRESVASWLHGVAYHVAVKARARCACRASHENRVKPRTSGDLLTEITVREAQEILNRELAQLPEKYRAPLVLCYLEGLTRDEAAQLLGCPLGTVRSRIDRARELLRTRLAKCGITLGSGSLVSILSDCAAVAAVPSALFQSTVKAAAVVTANGATASVVSAEVAALANGAVRAMFMNKLKIAVALFVILGVLSSGLFAHRAIGDKPQQNRPQEAAKPEGVPAPAKDAKPADEMTTLLKARVALAQKAYETADKSFGEVKRIGAVNVLVTKPEEVYSWSVRWLHAERDLNPKGADHVAALEGHLKRMTQLEKKVKNLVPSLLPEPAEFEAEWYRLEAELWLAQAKAKK